MATAPLALRNVLDTLPAPARQLELRHVRRQRFRWLVLLELPFKLLALIVAATCLFLMWLVALLADGHGGPDLDSGDGGVGGGLLDVRAFDRWHELVLVVQGEGGAALSETAYAPGDAARGHAALAAVLAAADRHGLVVRETLADGVGEPLEVWFGGQPLLAHPEVRDAERAERLLAGHEVAVVREEGGALRVVQRGRAVGRLRAGVAFVLALAVSPLLLVSAAFRRTLRETWLDLRGVPPEAYGVALEPAGFLTVERRRGERREVVTRLDARDLLGIAYSASLGYDRDVTRQPAALRLLTRDAAHRLEFALPHEAAGHALRDLLLARAVELWEGIPATTLRPTRCPYCGRLYPFAPETVCPSCGAPPGA